MANGKAGFGSKFGLAHSASSSVTAFAEITNISGPSMAGEDIDITHMESPDGFREFIAGLVDGGEVSVDLNYTADEQTNLHSYWRLTQTYGIQFADSTSTTAGDRSTFIFSGYQKGLGVETPLDDKISSTATYKVSGKPAFAKGAGAP